MTMLITTKPILEKIQAYFKDHEIKSSNPFPLNPYPPDYTRPILDPEIYEDGGEELDNIIHSLCYQRFYVFV